MGPTHRPRSSSGRSVVAVSAEGRTHRAKQRTLPLEPLPALVEHAQQRAENVQNRIADRITTYAGSMQFVYLHISTFVMISQNRADEKRQVVAAQEWKSVQLEEKQNEELLNLSHQILTLTNAIHQLTVAHGGGSGSNTSPAPTPSPS
jgi:uncharacterized membrane protein